MPVPTPFSHVPCVSTSRQRSRHRGEGPRLLTALVGALLAMGAYAGDAKPVQTAPTANEPATLPEPLRQDLSARLPAGLPIEIDNPYGSVFLRFGGYEHEVGIHSTLQQPPGAPTIEFLPEQGDGRYRIAPRLPDGATLAAAQRLDLVVYVPEKHPVRVRTHLGEIECRGVMSDMDLVSTAGNIAARGTAGTIQAETAEGSIEISFADTVPAGSRQRLATRTGSIVVGVTDQLDARVRMATSAMFSSDYSIQVERHDGEEPNKTAHAVIGTPKADVVLESRRGEIRLQRRVVYRTTPEEPSQQASGSERTP